MRTVNCKRTWATSCSILIFLLSLALPALGGEYKVTRVVDGDTIKVRSISGQTTIRLVGIDAPEVSHKKREPGQPFSQQASKYLAGLVLNKTVDIKEYGHDIMHRPCRSDCLWCCGGFDARRPPRSCHHAPSGFGISGACRSEEKVQEVVLYSIVKQQERGFGSAFVFKVLPQISCQRHTFSLMDLAQGHF